MAIAIRRQNGLMGSKALFNILNKMKNGPVKRVCIRCRKAEQVAPALKKCQTCLKEESHGT